MCSLKLSVIVVLALVGYVSAAAKPLSFQEVGRKLHSFGQKALPAVRGVCGFFNAYQGYPQGYPQGFSQAYPQGFSQGYQGYPQNFPQVNAQYPQGREYPQFQMYYPQISRTFPEQNPKNFFPISNSGGQKPPQDTASEQEDLIKFDNVNSVVIPPPQIQDILKNFDKLPKFDPQDFKDRENAILDPRLVAGGAQNAV